MATRREIAVPDPPADLSGDSAALWPGLVADLEAAGAGAEVDLILAADVLRARDRLAQVREILASEGLTTTGSKGQTRPHPLLDVEASLRREIAVGLDRLQLSPARRTWVLEVDSSGRLRQRG